MRRMVDDCYEETGPGSDQLLLMTAWLGERDAAPEDFVVLKTFELDLDGLDREELQALTDLPPLHLTATLRHLRLRVLVSLAGPEYRRSHNAEGPSKGVDDGE